MALDDETIRLILDMGSSGKNVEDVKKKLDTLGEAVETVDKKTRRSAEGLKGWTQSIIGAGRAAQDWAQGGFGAIINNIEQILAKFPVLGAVLTGLTAIIYAAWTPLVGFFKAWRDGVNDIPRDVGKFKALNDELKTTKERLEALEKQGWLTDPEKEEYLGLLARQASLEKDIADQKERQATFAKANAAATAPTKAQQERADVASTIINDMMGGVEKAIQQIGGAILNRPENQGALDDIGRSQASLLKRRDQARADGVDYIRARDRLNGGFVNVERERFFEEMLSRDAKKRDDILKRINEQANSLVQGALGGDSDAAYEIGRINPDLLRQWLQATEGGQKFADEQEAESEAFADRARRGTQARAAGRREAATDAEAQARFDENERRWEAGMAEEQERQRNAEKKRQAETRVRTSRRAARAEEQRQAEESTPEELRLSRALEYQAGFIERNAPDLKLTNEQQLAAAQEALKNSDAGLDNEDATAASLVDAVRQVVGPLRQGMGAQASLQGLIGELIQLQQEQAGYIQQFQAWQNQASQRQQVTRSRLRLGR